jgi:colicin import membrane protein
MIPDARHGLPARTCAASRLYPAAGNGLEMNKETNSMTIHISRAAATAVMAAALAMALPGCTHLPWQKSTPDPERATVATVPVTTSVAEADAKLADVKEKRAAVEARFADDEQLCYKKFFVSSCIDTAKEFRRVALADLRAVEVEANHYKRAESVRLRDANLAAQAQADATDAASRVATPARVEQPAPPQRTVAPGQSVADREAQHAARLKQAQAQEAANAGKRSANAAAYEKRQRDAQERQRRVKAREAENKAKAEREAKKDGNDAAAAAAAAAAASAASATPAKNLSQ